MAYYSPAAQKFTTIPLGDVCTITQDLNGNLWCGTNDSGIVCYSPLTGQSWRFSQAETGLASDIIVSSVTMADGTMYFEPSMVDLPNIKRQMEEFSGSSWRTCQ